MSEKCIGLMGRIFGHKFVKTTLYSQFDWTCCFRCGMRAGTPSPAASSEGSAS